MSKRLDLDAIRECSEYAGGYFVRPDRSPTNPSPLLHAPEVRAALLAFVDAASRPAPVEVRGVVKYVGETFVDVRMSEEPHLRIDLPAWPGARVGQGCTVTVTPDEE